MLISEHLISPDAPNMHLVALVLAAFSLLLLGSVHKVPQVDVGITLAANVLAFLHELIGAPMMVLREELPQGQASPWQSYTQVVLCMGGLRAIPL